MLNFTCHNPHSSRHSRAPLGSGCAGLGELEGRGRTQAWGLCGGPSGSAGGLAHGEAHVRQGGELAAIGQQPFTVQCRGDDARRVARVGQDGPAGVDDQTVSGVPLLRVAAAAVDRGHEGLVLYRSAWRSALQWASRAAGQLAITSSSSAPARTAARKASGKRRS